jgi:hypothetical protein
MMFWTIIAASSEGKIDRNQEWQRFLSITLTQLEIKNNIP